jgi:SAM-dependent methyltransferase
VVLESTDLGSQLDPAGPGSASRGIDEERYLTNHLGQISDPTSYLSEGFVAFRRYEQWLPNNKAARILEIGPGFGGFLAACQSAGYKNLEAIDISHEVAEVVARNTGIDVTISDNSTELLLQRSERYDAIVALEVVEHLPHEAIVPFVSACRQALAPRGALLLETPNMSNPLVGAHHRFADFTHRSGLTTESLRYVNLAAGFNSVEVIALPRVGRRLPVLLKRAAERVLTEAIALAYKPWGEFPAENMAPIIVSVSRK